MKVQRQIVGPAGPARVGTETETTAGHRLVSPAVVFVDTTLRRKSNA